MRTFLILILLAFPCLAFGFERGANVTVFSAISAANSTTAGPYTIDTKAFLTAQFNAVGSATGTYQLQVSDDPQVGSQYPLAADWVNLTNGAITVSTSTASAQITAQLPLTYSWLRVLWTPTAGTGTVTSNVQFAGY